MRILFSSVPAFGHLIPMLPLAAAARRAGHRVALLTHPSMSGAAPDLDLLPAGPSMAETLEDVSRRTRLDALDDMAQGAVEFFVESRLTLGADEALAAAEDFRPDLVVADMVDFVGQLAAAARGVPFAVHGSTLPLAEPLAVAFERAVTARFGQRSVTRGAPVAYVDPWPASLLRPTDRYPVTRIPIRPQPHSVPGQAWSRPRFAGREDRPVVLVTLGTVVEDATILGSIISSLAEFDVNILVAAGGTGEQTHDNDRVRVTGFVPMEQLLAASDLVVGAAGAGTLLATLSAGLPTVLLPLGLDKPVNAGRAAAAGVGLVVTDPGDVGAAVGTVLADPSYAAASAAVAGEMARTNSPGTVLETLLRLAGGRENPTMISGGGLMGVTEQRK
ncbi:glycosyltransferase [Actinoplanes sp. DH11]|uniref:glycosyltransferase n=1 Tax=Actinoplanes sp. DH11 TaxID=2857011 RepID=UPI001E4802A3|nr:nucleotide disphospho-sugar-binding domain-containing protein [Actinoplanes sp. DH11]